MVAQGKGMGWPKGGAVTHSQQVLGSPGLVVSARRAGPRRAVRQPLPTAWDPEGGACPELGLRAASSHLQGRDSAIASLPPPPPRKAFWEVKSRRLWRAELGKDVDFPLPSQLLTIWVCTGSACAADVVPTECCFGRSPIFPRLGVCVAPWR